MFGRFNSLIVDLISLFFGFISLFGQVGICTLLFRNINHLWAQNGSRDRQRSRFSLYIPVDQQGCPGKSGIGETELILDVGGGARSGGLSMAATGRRSNRRVRTQ